MSPLKISSEGERTLVISRSFNAAPRAVFEAHTVPGLVRRWMLGPPGWSMTQCEIDPVPGGRIAYEWMREEGTRFGITGTVLEVDAGHRILHTETMNMGGDSIEYQVETRFEATGGGTLLTMRLTYADAETRARMLETGMEHGVEASYVRLEGVLDSPGTESG